MGPTDSLMRGGSLLMPGPPAHFLPEGNMAKKKKKSRTIKFSKLQRLSFCNSKKMPLTVNLNGRRKHWVGIGWVDEGEATGREVKVID